jgi:anthranilate phosphoribosyltransferase
VFIAAVRAALGEASVLHGVDEMPPKIGITEEQILKTLGARTNLPLEAAATLIEDPEVGFAYVSQREYSPGAYAIRELRMHIKKRPPWAATEKAQQLFSASSNHMVIGYYHPGYEEPLLQLMWERGFRSGLVAKGEEGTSHYALRLGKPSVADRKAINYTQGFQRMAGYREGFALDINPEAFGFYYKKKPEIGISEP